VSRCTTGVACSATTGALATMRVFATTGVGPRAAITLLAGAALTIGVVATTGRAAGAW
jgi:hypothetical protein